MFFSDVSGERRQRKELLVLLTRRGKRGTSPRSLRRSRFLLLLLCVLGLFQLFPLSFCLSLFLSLSLAQSVSSSVFLVFLPSPQSLDFSLLVRLDKMGADPGQAGGNSNSTLCYFVTSQSPGCARCSVSLHFKCPYTRTLVIARPRSLVFLHPPSPPLSSSSSFSSASKKTTREDRRPSGSRRERLAADQASSSPSSCSRKDALLDVDMINGSDATSSLAEDSSPYTCKSSPRTQEHPQSSRPYQSSLLSSSSSSFGTDPRLRDASCSSRESHEDEEDGEEGRSISSPWLDGAHEDFSPITLPLYADVFCMAAVPRVSYQQRLESALHEMSARAGQAMEDDGFRRFRAFTEGGGPRGRRRGVLVDRENEDFFLEDLLVLTDRQILLLLRYDRHTQSVMTVESFNLKVVTTAATSPLLSRLFLWISLSVSVYVPPFLPRHPC